MYLKRLEMQGFKSFADKTTLEFMPGITSVIGPNGSGKSNIVDCIKWILGEQSMKELRGGKSSDIIFAGTQTRNAMANVGEITWDDIKYFGKNEMTCKCGCGLNNTDLRLMQIADGIREHFGSPAVITSGCRCAKHNAEVGGVQGSRHVLGKAMDFYIQGVPTQELLNYCQQLVNEGQLRYTYTNNANMNGVVHIDIL